MCNFRRDFGDAIVRNVEHAQARGSTRGDDIPRWDATNAETLQRELLQIGHLFERRFRIIVEDNVFPAVI